MDRSRSQLFRTFFLGSVRFIQLPKRPHPFLPFFTISPFSPFLQFLSFFTFFTIFPFLEIILPTHPPFLLGRVKNCVVTLPFPDEYESTSGKRRNASSVADAQITRSNGGSCGYYVADNRHTEKPSATEHELPKAPPSGVSEEVELGGGVGWYWVPTKPHSI